MVVVVIFRLNTSLILWFLVQIKEEPTVDFEDEYCDDSDTRGGATGDEDGPSESEMELGPHTW